MCFHLKEEPRVLQLRQKIEWCLPGSRGLRELGVGSGFNGQSFGLCKGSKDVNLILMNCKFENRHNDKFYVLHSLPQGKTRARQTV